MVLNKKTILEKFAPKIAPKSGFGIFPRNFSTRPAGARRLEAVGVGTSGDKTLESGTFFRSYLQGTSQLFENSRGRGEGLL